jgi:hypothetical protein
VNALAGTVLVVKLEFDRPPQIGQQQTEPADQADILRR